MNNPDITNKKIVIIPVFNESQKISSVLSKIPRCIDKVIVIDDASTDNTCDIVSKFDVELITHNKNLGKAISLKDGFQYALKNNYNTVITLDGDGEHDPAQIPDFLEKLNKSEFVIGQRKYHRSLIRKLTNKWSNIWFNILLQGVEDTQCGYRAIRKNVLKKLNLRATGFEIELEMLLEAVKHDITMGFVDIHTRPYKKTHLRFKDYLKINNAFDNWIIKNKDALKINKFKKFFLILSANIGLLCGKSLEKLLNL